MSICSDPRSSIHARGQRGDVLLEALIGVLLTAIIGGGMAMLAARISTSQTETKLQNLAVEELRARLQADGIALCDGTYPLSLPSDPGVSVDCPDPVDISVWFDGIASPVTVTPPSEITLSVAAASLTPGTATGETDTGTALEIGTHQ